MSFFVSPDNDISKHCENTDLAPQWCQNLLNTETEKIFEVEIKT